MGSKYSANRYSLKESGNCLFDRGHDVNGSQLLTATTLFVPARMWVVSIFYSTVSGHGVNGLHSSLTKQKLM
jgi:hypothetical protein